eukprot:7279654-Pyramimonas_sp.AAC.1
MSRCPAPPPPWHQSRASVSPWPPWLPSTARRPAAESASPVSRTPQPRTCRGMELRESIRRSRVSQTKPLVSVGRYNPPIIPYGWSSVSRKASDSRDRWRGYLPSDGAR